MVNYRRSKIDGGTYFFTVNLENRKSCLLTQHINDLRDSFRKAKQKYPFKILAIVVLPNHLHCIWELPQNDDNFSIRWQTIKSIFTKALKRKNLGLRPDKYGKYDVWQSRFWEHTIRDELDLENHVNYIHYNPVKHGLVVKTVDWPYSSFHKYLARGILDENWGYEDYETSGIFRE